MRYRSPRHRAAPTPSPDGVPDAVPSVDAPVLDRPVPDHAVRFVFTVDTAALDQRAA